MTAPRKMIPAAFYRTAARSEPVREWLKEMSAIDRRVIGTDIRTVEYGWPIGMPVCRSMGNGLFEVRSNISDGLARVLFCIHEGEMVLLHGFLKKTRKTPKSDLNLALARKKEIER